MIWIFLPKALKILPQTLPSLVFHVKQLPISLSGQRAERRTFAALLPWGAIQSDAG